MSSWQLRGFVDWILVYDQQRGTAAGFKTQVPDCDAKSGKTPEALQRSFSLPVLPK